ncbi:MAG TPA: Si-specific NAD(P)(+) transhydrogenase [Dehalococcoidia bacterium]|jgi:NAD(P) transhydrogenase|nr:Si-specific NAD(P)(+) transhydrogenase [Dehalococcoidia bacterium]
MGARYDLIVIGSGPAGEKGAARAAYFGKRVAIVEQAPEPGGAAINTGTIPSKTLRETALYFSGLRQRGLYGIDYSLRENVTVAELLYRERAVVQNERELVRRNLERHGIDVYEGRATLISPRTVRVTWPGGEAVDLEASAILIATGSAPYRPETVPFDDEVIYDSDSILRMKLIPRSMVVAGGGVIACEYAAMFTALGVAVTQVVSGDGLLAFVDREIADRLRAHLEGLGLGVVFNQRVAAATRNEGGVTLTLSSGELLQAEIALFAAGRRSNVEGLGLEALGVALGERGLVLVDERYQTSVPGIYAAGDVIGFPALASTSMEQGRVAVTHACKLPASDEFSPVVPLAVYSIPEVAQVGRTEEECRAQGIDYLVGRAYYAGNPRGQIIGDTSGMLKLLFAPKDLRLLGAHLIGELASELIHIGAHVLGLGGTIETFQYMVYNYPTLSDVYKYAAYDGLGARDHWLSERGRAAV